MGGRGLFLVQQMMGEVDYQRRDGCNVVTLKERTSDEENASAPTEADKLLAEEVSP